VKNELNQVASYKSAGDEQLFFMWRVKVVHLFPARGLGAAAVSYVRSKVCSAVSYTRTRYWQCSCFLQVDCRLSSPFLWFKWRLQDNEGSSM
jgi:hypothetical protein